jgi:predicted amidophosphoribosyltransferase
MFKEVESGDHLLVLPPFYARLFEAHFPSIMNKSEHGFADTTRGNNKRAFFDGLVENHIKSIEAFIAHYKQHVVIGRNKHISPFFSDEVDFCVALDFNRLTPAADRTEVGQWEFDAKYHQNGDAREELSKLLASTVRRLPQTIYTTPRRLTYVPSDPDKEFYLPSLLAEDVIDKLPDNFWGHDDPLVEPTLTVEKASAKNLNVQQKVKQWEEIVDAGGIELSDEVQGDSVCIIDDLCQSGASLWSYAKFLKAEGAVAVLGVVCVKSLRNTDNQ